MILDSVRTGWMAQHGAVHDFFGLKWVPWSINPRRLHSLIPVWIIAALALLYLMSARLSSGFSLRSTEWVLGSAREGSNSGNSIPQKIWQIYLPPRGMPPSAFTIKPDRLVDTPSWLAKNPDYTYTLVGWRGADDFVREYFQANKTIRRTFNALSNPGLKSDLLRYLILYAVGGTYADTDTEAIQPISKWVPPEMRDRARVVVGLEFDRLDGPMWADIPHELQFCQWTIAAAPGHPLFKRMAERAVQSLDELATLHGTTVADLRPTSFEVMNSTGPAAWTDMVFEQLQLADPTIENLRNLSGIFEPRLYGDIVVLPIDGFGMGQLHSNSTSDGSTPEGAMIRHNFHGSWRDPAPPSDDEDKDKKEE